MNLAFWTVAGMALLSTLTIADAAIRWYYRDR